MYRCRWLMLRISGLLCLSLCLISCVHETISGSGAVIDQVRPVRVFHYLRVRGALHLIVLVNQPRELTVRADDNLQPYILTSVVNHQLRIATKRGYTLSPTTPITITVHVPKLSGILLRGNIHAMMSGIQGRRFDIQCVGQGTLQLAGTVNSVSMGIVGDMPVEARDLQANVVSLDLTGNAKVRVYARKKLNVKISGAGEVRYHGHPAVVNQALFGHGQVIAE